MPLYNEGFGSALGDALGGFTTQFIGTQNTLKQQDQQRQQQELDNQYREQQAAEQRRQYETTRTDNRDVNDKNLGQQALTNRGNDYRTIVGPQVDSYMKDLDAEAARYAPTLANGAPNPQYSPSLYEGAKTRAKAAQKAWNDLTLTVTSGQGYDEARANLLHSLGGAATGTATAPPKVDYSFPPAAQPAPPVQTTVARGDAVANGVTAPQGPPAPAQPAAPAGLPADVQAIRPSDLMDIPDDQLLARYGQSGLEYATAARTQYQAQQAATRKAAFTAQNAMWKTVIGNITSDKDHPATAAQINAAGIITAYGSLLESGESLTEQQQQEYGEAVRSLAPLVYTAATWQKVLDTKDPAIISQSYKTYQKVAPDVVAGFDVTPFTAAVTDAHDKAVTAQQLDRSTIQKNQTDGISTAQATNLKGILGGASSLADVVKSGDTTTLRAIAANPESLALLGITDGGMNLSQVADRLDAGEDADQLVKTTQAGQNVAQTGAALATTDKTVADTGKIKFDQGVATLGQLAGTGATIFQLQYDGSNTWFNLKQSLHLSDGELAAVFQQARWEADQRSKGIELTNTYKSSQILTDGAQRAQAIANTADTISTTRARDAKLQPELDKLNQDIINAQLQGQDTTSLIRRRDALLPYDVQQAQANVTATQTNTAETVALLPGKVALQGSTLQLNTAQIGNIASGITSRNRRDQAYISSVAGQVKVDDARVKQITADTALTQLKTTHPELFRSSGQAGDPMDALKKRAGLNYTAADQALRQAQALQTQINSMQPKTDLFGNVSGTPPDPALVAKLTGQRDKLMQRAVNQRALGDKVIQDGLPGVITPNTNSGSTGKQVVTYQQLGGSLGLPTARTGTPFGQAYGPNGSWGTHNGDDIFAPVGTPIKAPFTGYVSVKHSETTGNELILTDASGQKMLLGHLDGYAPGLQDAITKAGGRLLVPAGKPVGFVGQTGTLAHSDVPNNSHTHVMAYDASGKVVNPLSIQFKGVQGPAPTQTAGKPPPTKPPPTTPAKVSTGAALPKTPAAAVPSSITPKGSAGPYMGALASSGWIARAQGVTDNTAALQLLDAAAKKVMPNGSAAQIATLKNDLARTMGWIQ